MLLFFNIAGLNLPPPVTRYAYEAVEPARTTWAPCCLGLNFIRLSGANRTCLMLLVQVHGHAMQSFGEQFFNPYAAFWGDCIAPVRRSSPVALADLLSPRYGFWFLVPGARGLLSVTSILGEDLQSAAIGLGEMVILIISIALGVLLGTLIISPHKFVPLTVDLHPSRNRRA
jgi:hypothetical protein